MSTFWFNYLPRPSKVLEYLSLYLPIIHMELLPLPRREPYHEVAVGGNKGD